MCTKNSYPSKKKAKQAAYAIKAKGYIGCRDALFPYFCRSCNSFHLSSKNNEQYFHGLK